MLSLSVAMIVLVPLLVAIYTFNYARWAWKRKLRRGAIGLFLLAASTLVVPVWVVWRNS